LLSKKQLEKMFVLTKEKRVTLIPLKAYPKNGKIKILLGVGKGKKNYDKRESLKQKDQKRHLKE
jgi:SsrA-binding protein